MNKTINKKLLLTLSLLAYGFQVSGANATEIREEEQASRSLFRSATGSASSHTASAGAHTTSIKEEEKRSSWGLFKSVAGYTSAGIATAVGSIYAFGDKQEELIQLKSRAINGVTVAGQILWEQTRSLGTMLYNGTAASYQFLCDTYEPYHPTVKYVADEAIRLGFEGCTAVKQTVIEHPYVATGFAVTFVAAVGITYAVQKSKANKAEHLLEEEKKRTAELAKELEKVKAEEKKARQLAIKAREALRAENPHIGPTVAKTVTNANPMIRVIGDDKSSTQSHVGDVQGGSVTFNLIVGDNPLSGHTMGQYQKFQPARVITDSSH